MEKDLIFLFKSFLFRKMRNIQGHQYCHNTFGGFLFPLQNSKIWMSHSQHFRWFVCSSTTSVPRGLEKAFSKEARKHVCKLFGILETNWFFTNWMSRILNWLFLREGKLGNFSILWLFIHQCLSYWLWSPFLSIGVRNSCQKERFETAGQSEWILLNIFSVVSFIQ